MATEVLMPKLGLTMEEGTVLEWLKQEGEPIIANEILFQIETEKSAIDVEAQVNGVMGPIIVQPGNTVPVGTLVGYILAEGEEFSHDLKIPESKTAPPAAKQSGETTQTKRKLEDRAGEKYIKASPVAKRLAREAGLDLTTIPGTGPGGRIVEADVLRTIDEQETRPEDPVITSLSHVRRVIAQRMSQSITEAPQVTLMAEVEATALVRTRSTLNAERTAGQKISYNDLLIFIAARALQEFPAINSKLVNDKIHQMKEINVGLAVDTERGLIVPVISGVDRMSLEEIASATRSLMTKIQNSQATPDDLSGGTFTITNLGVYDIDLFTPIINPPECAILGVGRITARVVPVNNGKDVGIRQMMGFSLTFDHRLVDGAPAARFLQHISYLIQNLSPDFSPLII